MRRTCRTPAVLLGILVLSLVLCSVEEASALHNVVIPDQMQSQVKKPIKRTISLKLPIRDVHFHWEFLDRAELLAGKLLLRITRDQKVGEIVVFQGGKFANGWGPMTDESLGKTGKNPIYFGFKSKTTYLIAPGDKVEVILVAKQDLKGIGALLTGHLPAGTYKSEVKSAWLTDKSQRTLIPGAEQNAAFESWLPQWPLVVTSEQGWTPPERVESVRKMMKQVDALAKPDPEPAK